jgi:hypothetical protein
VQVVTLVGYGTWGSVQVVTLVGYGTWGGAAVTADDDDICIRVDLDPQIVIWKDPEFMALSVHAQWLYWHLLAKRTPENGVLRLDVAGWAGLAADMTEDKIRRFLGELHDHRIVLIDEAANTVFVDELPGVCLVHRSEIEDGYEP